MYNFFLQYILFLITILFYYNIIIFILYILTNTKCAGSATASSAATWIARFILGRLCVCVCVCSCVCVYEKCKFQEKFPFWRYTSSVYYTEDVRRGGEIERACKAPGPDATLSGRRVVGFFVSGGVVARVSERESRLSDAADAVRLQHALVGHAAPPAHASAEASTAAAGAPTTVTIIKHNRQYAAAGHARTRSPRPPPRGSSPKPTPPSRRRSTGFPGRPSSSRLAAGGYDTSVTRISHTSVFLPRERRRTSMIVGE